MGNIFYIDDDDFYPPQKVSHFNYVESHKGIMCWFGNLIYFYEIDKIYQFPYGKTSSGVCFLKKKFENEISR
ncbi:MAG: hypothetical protein CM15mP58_07610 [Burkholderiaceae bacterium]|nr:MAG: hypothetical protein CM15mP58_07610 [Burkholderiaceae bacterium]